MLFMELLFKGRLRLLRRREAAPRDDIKTLELLNASIFCEPQLGGKVFDEITVMNHSQHRAFELIERLLEARSRWECRDD